MAGAVLTFTKESRLVLNLLLVSRRHSAKGAPRVSFGSSLSLHPRGKALMRPLHKANFRAFLVAGFMDLLNSGGPSVEVQEGVLVPPERNCPFLAEAFKNPLQAGVRAGARTRLAICSSPVAGSSS